MGRLVEETQAARDLMTLETIEAQSVADKIKGIIPARGDTVFEVVLHTEGMDGERAMLPEFSNYLRGLGVDASLNHRFYAGGLCFVELEAPAALAESIALFSIVRAVRQMPQLRVLQPAFRTSGIPSVAVELPPVAAMDASINVAIFDGGLPPSHGVLITESRPGGTGPLTRSLSSWAGFRSRSRSRPCCVSASTLPPCAPFRHPWKISSVLRKSVSSRLPTCTPGKSWQPLTGSIRGTCLTFRTCSRTRV